MKKRFTAIFLALALCLGLAIPAFAAPSEEALPDWYFLFAVFKNVNADCDDGRGTVGHTTYTMSKEEVNLARENARQFEDFLNQFGLICAHVEVVEIETPVTELQGSDYGSYLDAVQAAPLLEGKVDLDQYDHVTSVVSLNVDTVYVGMTGSLFENGTGHSTVNLKDTQRHSTPVFPESLYVHEFLHVMEYLNLKWGACFNLHDIQEKFYAPTSDEWEVCYTDVILNRAKGNAETGTGVYPAAWQYPPHILRTVRGFKIPDGAATIGGHAFQSLTSLEQVTIPSSVASIGEWAFAYCGSLNTVTIPNRVTSIEQVTFYDCRSLRCVTIPASVTSIGEFAFGGCNNLSDVYYGGSKEQWEQILIENFNDPLTRANIYYNSLMADVKVSDFYAAPVAWALEKDLTNGTGNGKFSPAQACTHAQILTFLYRANRGGGTASAQDMDLAVQWAREKGMIDSSFNGGAFCTRAEAVNYIWQALGRQSAKTGSFTDVPPGAGYARAVDWAVANGVTNGTNAAQTEFSPNKVCDRGTIVTFLHRAYVPSARLK